MKIPKTRSELYAAMLIGFSGRGLSRKTFFEYSLDYPTVTKCCLMGAAYIGCGGLEQDKDDYVVTSDFSSAVCEALNISALDLFDMNDAAVSKSEALSRAKSYLKLNELVEA